MIGSTGYVPSPNRHEAREMNERRHTDDDAVIPWLALDARSDLRDEADDFEDALIEDMRRRGLVDADVS